MEQWSPSNLNVNENKKSYNNRKSENHPRYKDPKKAGYREQYCAAALSGHGAEERTKREDQARNQ
jgi:hypothetical protein